MPRHSARSYAATALSALSRGIAEHGHNALRDALTSVEDTANPAIEPVADALRVAIDTHAEADAGLRSIRIVPAPGQRISFAWQPEGPLSHAYRDAIGHAVAQAMKGTP